MRHRGARSTGTARLSWRSGLAGVCIVVALTASVVATSGPAGVGQVAMDVPVRGLVEPGAALPSGDECRATVSGPGPEVRPENAASNARPGDGVPVSAWPDAGYDPAFNRSIVPRIDGLFTGTTDQILAWGACKWGLPADVVRAMAVEESNWRQSTTGDVSDDSADCVPGHTPPCATSFGILQVKHIFRPDSYPRAAESTAFNVDYALAAVRGCYEGWVTYLEPNYSSGDMWGCVGWHFSGEWRDEAATGYVGRVQAALAAAPWRGW